MKKIFRIIILNISQADLNTTLHHTQVYNFTFLSIEAEDLFLHKKSALDCTSHHTKFTILLSLSVDHRNPRTPLPPCVMCHQPHLGYIRVWRPHEWEQMQEKCVYKPDESVILIAGQHPNIPNGASCRNKVGAGSKISSQYLWNRNPALSASERLAIFILH